MTKKRFWIRDAFFIEKVISYELLVMSLAIQNHLLKSFGRDTIRKRGYFTLSLFAPFPNAVGLSALLR